MTSIRLLVSGDWALFTRPEMKVERVSYDVITPSAARGVLEAIYWKPEIRWHVRRLRVFRPIRFANLRRNEVASKVSVKGKAGVAAAMKAGSGTLALYADQDRQQRAALMLRDVCYGIEARFEIWSGENNVGKHLDIFRRRAERGQCFHRPYLGTRECPAAFEWVASDEGWPAVDDSLRGERDLGFMLHDIDYENGRTSRFFRATMTDGVIEVPAWDAEEVLA